MPFMNKTESEAEQETRRSWLSKWWPCLLLVAITLWGVVDYFFITESDHNEFIKFLLNGIGVLAILVYVIYTKELSESSQQIAEANIRLVESTQSRILEQWVVQKCKTVSLIGTGEEVSKVIHVKDKHMTEKRYKERVGRPHRRILIFRPMNMGTRPVLLRSVKFKISDSRCKVERDISYDPDPPAVLQKDSSIDIQVIYDIEGEINARVAEIDYQDGEIKQTSWLANPFTEERHEEEKEPEEEKSEEKESEDEIPF